MTNIEAAAQAAHIRAAMPEAGMFRDKSWRVSPLPFPIAPDLIKKIEALGSAAHAFQRACNDLYHRSAAGEIYPWVAKLLDQGKPQEMIALGRDARWRDELPRLIRPDLILTERGLSITELDSLPGGIGLTGWLGQTYTTLGHSIIGGANGMTDGFSKSFPKHDVLISRESGDYQPEMEWLLKKTSTRRVLNPWSTSPRELAGRSIYRFFELWDVANVEHGDELLAMGRSGEINFTPPLKPFLEEKIWLALFWNPQLRDWWQSALNGEHHALLREMIPFGWVLDPVTLAYHAEWPQLGIRDWNEMKSFGGKERELVIKISGWSEKSWGSRGVTIGHDLPQEEWCAAIDDALQSFPTNPHLMQRFENARIVPHPLWDEAKGEVIEVNSRVRLCPYYFVSGGDVKLGGILATIVPADKKILHGMTDAMIVPCAVRV